MFIPDERNGGGMNDDMYYEILLVAHGCLGGLVRVLAKNDVTLRSVIANVLLGGVLASTIPAICIVLLVVVRTARSHDVLVFGGVAILVGFYGSRILPCVVKRADDVMESLGDWLFRKIIFPIADKIKSRRNRKLKD